MENHAFHLLVLLVPCRLTWIAFDSIFQENVVEMEGAHPCGISIWDLTRPIYNNCRPTRFFRVNIKQPTSFRLLLCDLPVCKAQV